MQFLIIANPDFIVQVPYFFKTRGSDLYFCKEPLIWYGFRFLIKKIWANCKLYKLNSLF